MNVPRSKKLQTIAKCTGFVCALFCAMTTGATDGVCAESGEWCNNTWNTRANWWAMQVAEKGGIATFLGGNFTRTSGSTRVNYLNQNVSGLTLSGLRLNRLETELRGLDITMTGAAPFVFSTNTLGSSVTLQMKGTGTNTLLKTGVGSVRFDTPVTDFAAVEVQCGTLLQTNTVTTGTLFATPDIPIVLNGGGLAYKPMGTDAECAATTGPLFYGPGLSRVEVTRGSAASASLEASSLSRRDQGLLVIKTDSATASETFTVAGETNAVLVSSVILAADKTNVTLAAYSADQGFIPAATESLIPGAAQTGLVTVGADLTLDTDTSAPAVRIDNRAKLTVNAKLSVANENGPGCILLANQSSSGNHESLNGSGEIAFGSHDGLIFRAVPSAYNNLSIGVRMTGSGGLTFASAAERTEEPTSIFFPLDYQAAWTGPTRATGVRLVISEKNLPEGADVIVSGNDQSAGSIVLGHGTYSQKFSLSGPGGRNYASLIAGTNKSTRVTLTGPVSVPNDASISVLNEVQLLVNGGMSGSGGLNARGEGMGSDVRFSSTNALEGPLTLSGTLYAIFTTPESLGTSPITLNNTDTRMVVSTPTGSVARLSKEVSGAGALCFQDADASLAAPISTGDLRLYGTSDVTAAKDVTMRDCLADPEAVLAAADGTDITLNFDLNNDDSSFAGALSDGAGKLGIKKTGSRTLEFMGRKTYTGPTCLMEGTLKLETALTNSASLVYWMDAADKTTLTTDTSGRVSEWRSKTGNGVVFRKFSNFSTPDCTNTLNGLPVITFNAFMDTATADSGSVTAQRLGANRSVTQRTVFFACRPDFPEKSPIDGSSILNLGFWGASGRDLGLRGDVERLDTTKNGSTFSTVLRRDGVVWDGWNKSINGGYVLTLQHTYDTLTGQYSSFADFFPLIGGYATWGNRANGYLSFSGDIAEVLAFDRILTEAETCRIENYLSMKWFGKQAHTDVPPVTDTENLLPTTTDLEIAAPATLDLNGVNQTIRTLSGHGRIINSSTLPATLTVTDETSFNGSIGAGVTLMKADNRDATLNIHVAPGGTLAAAGGSTRVETFNEAPVTNGMTIWLDASFHPGETIQADGNGTVTNWVCRDGTSLARFHNDGTFKDNAKKVMVGPKYDVAGMNGKPALYFNTTTSALWSVKTVSARTVFLIVKRDKTGAYMWGPKGEDCGVRVYDGSVSVFGRFALLFKGETARINGVDCSGPDAETVYYFTPPLCLANRMEDYSSTRFTKTWVAGEYMQNGFTGWISEIIAYDRRLTDAEMLRVENYLMNKWIRSGSSLPVTNTSAFASGAKLAVSGGASADLAGADVTVSTLTAGGGTLTNVGTLTVTDELYVPVHGNEGQGTINPLVLSGNLIFGAAARVVIDDYRNLSRVCRFPALTVEGTVTGDLSRTNITEPVWQWTESGKTWRVGYCAGTLLLMR